MQSLVFIYETQPVTTSLIIADHCQYDHASVLKLVRNHVEDLEEFGRVRFEIQPFETAGGVQQREISILNEQQATFLITLMNNNQIVLQFKKALVKAFFQMRDALRLDQPEPDYFKRVDVTMQHVRGITNPTGLDIAFRLDLTKVVQNPTKVGLEIVQRLTGVQLEDILPSGVDPMHKPDDRDIVFSEFLASHITRVDRGLTLLKDIYTAFNAWAGVIGYPLSGLPSRKRFAALLRHQGYNTLHSGGNVYVQNIAVVQ